jgi:hypothetical protein
MKSKFFYQSMLLIALMCMVFVGTSCSDDDEEAGTIVYSMGFNEVNTSDFGEMIVIETAYYKALGVNDQLFRLSGKVKDCDEQVKAACKNAENVLKQRHFKGQYLFVVKNYTTQKEIYSYQIN